MRCLSVRCRSYLRRGGAARQGASAQTGRRRTLYSRRPKGYSRLEGKRMSTATPPKIPRPVQLTLLPLGVLLGGAAVAAAFVGAARLSVEGQELRRIPCRHGAVLAVAFAPDGRSFLAG